MKRNEKSLQDLRENNETIYTLSESQKERRGEEGAESLFNEMMVENFANIGRNLEIQVYESLRSSNIFNPKKCSLRHSIVKLSKMKDKEKKLKAAREKKLVIYKGTLVRLAADFYVCPIEMMQESTLLSWKGMKESTFLLSNRNVC